MKKIKRNLSKSTSKNIVAIKVMAFLSWLIYIGIAFANNMMIEAFIFSVGLVIAGYLITGRKTIKKQVASSTINSTRKANDSSPSQNYLSVFFHSSDQTI